MIRRLVLVMVLALLVGSVAYDRVDRVELPVVAAAAVDPVVPSVASPPALSSAWYCPMGVDAADQTVVVTNVGTDDVVGSIDVLTGDGPGPSLRFRIPGHSAETYRLADLVQASVAGAAVEITGGQAVVGHRIGTGLALIEGPCASAASDTWHFAAGATTRDSREIIAVLNPSYDDVVFSAVFRTPTRTIAPGDLEAAVVPARSVRLIEVTDAVSREPVVSAQIETVRGRLAVERLQLVDGTLGPLGAALTLGVVAPATTWRLPVGQIHEGGDARVLIANPTQDAAEVDLYLEPMDPADRGRYGLVPEELDIRPGGVVDVDLDELVARIGLPLPAELGVRVVSANATPVLVERWQFTPGLDESLIGAGGTNARQTDEGPEVDVGDGTEEQPAGDGVAPNAAAQATPTRGLLISRGVEVTAERWAFPVLTLSTAEGTSTMIAVSAEVDTLVTVRVVTGGSLGTPTTITVPAEGMALIPVTSTVGFATVLVEADQPIAVEASRVEVDQRNDAVAGVPFLAGAAEEG